MKTKGELFTEAYKAGQTINVSFIKKNGSKREMTVKKNKEAEMACVGGVSHCPANSLAVWSVNDNGWRTVNLETITNFTII